MTLSGINLFQHCTTSIEARCTIASGQGAGNNDFLACATDFVQINRPGVSGGLVCGHTQAHTLTRMRTHYAHMHTHNYACTQKMMSQLVFISLGVCAECAVSASGGDCGEQPSYSHTGPLREPGGVSVQCSHVECNQSSSPPCHMWTASHQMPHPHKRHSKSDFFFQ